METKQSIVTDIKEFLSENYDLSYNLITRNLEISGEPVNDLDLNSMFVACRTAHRGATQPLVNNILYSEFTKQYNPFTDFIETYQNDQLKDKNIRKLIDSIKTDTPNHDLFIRKWLCSIMASVHGKHSPLMLVLCGGQNTGKTEWFRRLLPGDLQGYYAESKLDEGKDADILMTKKLIIMDDEMGGKSKKDEKNLKSRLSKQTFTVREPYGHVSVDLRRLAMLCGTTNDSQIINDPTGNRRILPINVLSIDHSLYNEINHCHLFIEIYNLYKSGYSHELSKEDIQTLNESTSDFEAVSVEEESICKYFAVPEGLNSHKVVYLTSTDILTKIHHWTPFKISVQRLGVYLQKLGFEQITKRIEGRTSPSRVYAVIELDPI